jgi:ATP-dependent RNA helicase RhlE
MTFEEFDLHPQVAAGVRTAGYQTPTPIQHQAIPAVLAGRDVMGLAKTGSGKTAAFALPILQRLMSGPRRRTRALVVAPTRELAEQIHESFRLLGGHTGLRSATVYGGVGMQPQIAALRRGTEIIVACPGRLLDHLRQGNADLSAVEFLVLDEADHMFDMGFLPDVRSIVRQIPQERQTMLFSATMPDDIRRLVREVLIDPATFQIEHNAPVDTVDHAIYLVGQKEKTDLLIHLLKREDPRAALVFTRTKHRAKRLAQQLDRMDFFVTSLQGNLSQRRRQEALDGFREGRFHVLVATDIAARGIDVARVSHVINYDMPNSAETYTHRIGRTGRAERSGEALTFVTSEDGSMVRAIERLLGEALERVSVDGFGRGVDLNRSSNGGGRPSGRSGGQGRGGNSGGRSSGGRSSGGRGGRGDERARSTGPARSEQARPSSPTPSAEGGSAGDAPSRRRRRRRRGRSGSGSTPRVDD